MRDIKLLTLVIMGFILVSCGVYYQSKSFVREGVDPSYITKVAVLKFENNSRNSHAAERLRNIVITQILGRGLFDVVDKSLVDNILEEEMLGEKVFYNKATLRRIAKKLGIQAVVVGSVDEYEMKRRGSYNYPVVALTLRLIDASTGEILWEASGTVSGYSTLGRIFGLKPKDFTQLSLDLVGNLLDSLSFPIRKT